MMLNKLFNFFIDQIFPTKCIACSEGNISLCEKCKLSLPVSLPNVEPYIISILDYRDSRVRKLVWSFKYRNNRNLAHDFALIINDRLTEELSELKQMNNIKQPILIPIPISNKKMKFRGYNQSELIARQLYKLDNGNHFKLEIGNLVKTKETKSQARTSNKTERAKNLRGSFCVKNEKLIRGQNIILIDDVCTTGSTINEARKTLKKSGAKRVIAITLAH